MTVSPSLQLVRLADELRALSNAGLMFTQDPYQIERYHRIVEIAAELLSLAHADSAAEIHALFLEDMTYATPYSVVDTAIFDEMGRILLIQRSDTALWALPGGACEIGESPSTAARREAWEETEVVVEIDGLVGVFDARHTGTATLHHLYILLFAAHVVGGTPRVTRETLDIRWFAPTDIPWDALHGHHGARIEQALRWHNDPLSAAYFDREAWAPKATFQHEHRG